MSFRGLIFTFIFCLGFVFLSPMVFGESQFDNSSGENLFNEISLSEKFVPTIMLEARIDVPLHLDLKKVLDFAIKQNLDVVGAEFEKDLKKWNLVENIGNYLPDYSLGLSTQRFDGNFLVGGIFPVMALTSSANAFMRFDYRFFEGGRGLFNTLRAHKLYKAANENFSGVLNDILLSAYKTYNYLLLQKANLNVQAKAREEAKANLDLNESLKEAGIGTKFDVLQAETKLAEEEQYYILAEEKFREAAINLARLLNLNQETHIEPNVKDLNIKELYSINKPVPEIIAEALKNRPELKKTTLEYKAQRNLIGVAFSEYLPKANFFGQYGGTGNVFFNRTKIRTVTPDAILLDEEGNPLVQKVKRDRLAYQLIDPNINVSDFPNVSNVVRGGGKPFAVAVNDSLMVSRFIGVQLNWDVGDGLGIPTISKINQARYDAKLIKNTIEKLKQQIENEVRIAYLNVQVAKDLINVAEKRVKAATEALRLARLRLENGIGINTELLNAQTDYTKALVSKVQAIVEYNNAQADLLHSIGLISYETLTK